MGLGSLIGSFSFKNCFSFMKDKKLITLVQLTPKQVYEDQVRLKQECEIERRKDIDIRKESERKKGGSFYTKDSELKSAFYSTKLMFILLYKEMLLNIGNLDSSLSSVVSSLLREFKYVIPEDDPSGLRPEETKELQRQVHVLYMYYLNLKMMDRGGCVMRFKEQMIRFKCQLG